MISISDDERLLLVTGEHWIKYVAPCVATLALLCMSIFLFLLAGRTPADKAAGGVAFVSAVGFLLCALHLFFHAILSERVSIIAVTNKRVIQVRQSLFMNDDMTEINLDKVQVVNAEKRGVLQNVLGYGTVSFRPHGNVTHVPHPHRFAKEIMQVLEMK